MNFTMYFVYFRVYFVTFIQFIHRPWAASLQQRQKNLRRLNGSYHIKRDHPVNFYILLCANQLSFFWENLTVTKGGATIFKVGVQKNFFDPPTFGTWGDIKQDITVFITAIMTYKRLYLPAPNDYNIGLCDYCGYGETETVKECHFWVLVTVYY